jgi:hypothetical protein
MFGAGPLTPQQGDAVLVLALTCLAFAWAAWIYYSGRTR